MDIYSLHNTIKFNTDTNEANLFEPILIYNTNIAQNTYTVTTDDEMRIDLILQNIYDLEANVVYSYLENIDILLRLNNIDNPLDIRAGMELIYPEIGRFEDFRYSYANEDNPDTNVTKQLGVANLPNKQTKVDPARQQFVENDYSLSPVVLDTPREPVRIENGRFSIGGL